MTTQKRRDERADGHHPKAARTKVVQGAANELRADPGALDGLVDLRVHEDDDPRLDPVADDPDELTVAQRLVPQLLGVVPDDELVHARLGAPPSRANASASASRSASDSASKKTRWTSATCAACASRASSRPASVSHAFVARPSSAHVCRSTSPRAS